MSNIYKEIKRGENMHKFNNSKQITIKKQHRLGSQEEQPLLFLLVHLILCYVFNDGMN